MSTKHQVTVPLDALREARIRTGDRLRADAQGAGRTLLVRKSDPVSEFSGSLTGAFPADGLEELRREWG